MKLSEVSREYLSDYLRLDDPEPEELREIDAAMQAAKAYIKSYTGLTEEEMDKHPDITTAYTIIVADMFENRALYLDYKSTKINHCVDTILSMYATNLI